MSLEMATQILGALMGGSNKSSMNSQVIAPMDYMKKRKMGLADQLGADPYGNAQLDTTWQQRLNEPPAAEGEKPKSKVLGNLMTIYNYLQQ